MRSGEGWRVGRRVRTNAYMYMYNGLGQSESVSLL